MNACPFCDSVLAPGPPWAPGKGYRLAYDPERGRLWNVCSRCSRWTLTPIESRWEVLETCEAAVQDRGKVLFSTPHLSLVDIGDGELIRVGLSPRPEFVDWRYGPRLHVPARQAGFWTRLLLGLPSPPVGGYDPYRGFQGAISSKPWLASPFLDSASPLTYLFSQVPLAPECPACRGPLALHPWDFQRIRFIPGDPVPGLLATCAFCEIETPLDLEAARPALRMGLGVVTPPSRLRDTAAAAAHRLDESGGPQGLLESLSGSRETIGGLDLPILSALLISLDEMADVEALEAEWRKAEELAAIMDGELSTVPGFDAFRRRILESES